MTESTPGPSLVCPGCGSPVDLRRGPLCGTCTPVAEPLVLPPDEFELVRTLSPLLMAQRLQKAEAELARLQTLLIAVRKYRAVVDEDGEIVMLGQCAETIGCLWQRNYDGDDGVSLGGLIDEALEHEGKQGEQAHACIAEINGTEEEPSDG